MIEIVVKPGVKTSIKKALKTSYPTIRAALSGRADTPMAKKIRKVAVNEYDGLYNTKTNTSKK